MKVWCVFFFDQGEKFLHEIYSSYEEALKNHPDALRIDSFVCIEEWDLK